MEKEYLSRLDAYKKVRKKWIINPAEQVVQSKKKYNRAQNKWDWRKALEDEESADDICE